MFLRILKRDLKNKKTMNVILLVFIFLVSMFVASSANNITTVINGLDRYFEQANAPDFLVLSMDKNETGGMEAALNRLDVVESYTCEPYMILNPEHITHNGERLEALQGSSIFHSFTDTGLKFFDGEDQVITEVEPGTILLSGKFLQELGLKVGDCLDIRIGDVCESFTIAGKFKDVTSIALRFMVSEEDYAKFATLEYPFRGTIYYIASQDPDAVETALNMGDENIYFLCDQSRLKTAYIMDMVVAGVLLIVSVCLILIAFVMLRFTISFTLTQEYRQIGVMKAIGLPNHRIRLLYMSKYSLISIIGAAMGFFASIPFSDLLLDSVSQTMVIASEGKLLLNGLCSLAVVILTLLFCFSCTRKVKKFTPVDAIRSGTTGERFRKKGLLHLGKSPMKPTLFLACNDVLSSPKRFGAVILTFSLCLSLVLILVNSANTLKSGRLIKSFSMTYSDLYFYDSERMMEFFAEDGHELAENTLRDMEKTLEEHGMSAHCCTEVSASLTLTHGDKVYKSTEISQGIGTTADQYDYFEGTPPQNAGEIAVTKLVAEKLDAQIGDRITICQLEGDREYIITALFQSMMSMGDGVRLHETADISYAQLSGSYAFQIRFADNPSKSELRSRAEQIKEIFHVDAVYTADEFVETMVGVAKTIDQVKTLVLSIILIIIVLVTVLMEYSFLTKERSEIALLKATGFSNSSLVAWHTLRFGISALVAVLLSLLTLQPLTSLSVGPIFSMMGADFGVEYEIVPLEVYVLYPLFVLIVTVLSACLTALHLRSIPTSECSNVD